MKLQLLIVVIVFFVTCPIQGQNRVHNLNDSSSKHLKVMSSSDAQSTMGVATALRARELFINPVLQDDKTVRVNDTIILDIFNDKIFKALIDKIETDVNGTFKIQASLPAYKYGTCEISTYENKSLIVIDIPETNELFKANFNHDAQTYYLLEIDKSKQLKLEGGPSIVPPNKKKLLVENGEIAYSKDIPDNNITSLDASGTPTTITLLIAYTPAAASWSSSHETSIYNTISSIMSKSQLALDNSNTLINLHLVHSVQVEYTELDSSEDLSNLAGTNDGYMDNVHTLRNEYGADVVVLLCEVSFTGGLAYVLNSTSGHPQYAFSLTRVQQAGWTYTTIHEIGHNMGCHHHKDQNVQPGPGIFPYSAGWRWTGNNEDKYCSIMTYEDGDYFADEISHSRVPYFSDPDILYQEVPTGEATNANNAKTLRETKNVVADYRSVPDATTVSTPDASDIWLINTNYYIIWNDNISENVKIELYDGDLIASTISSSTINDGSYEWLVPSSLSAGNNYRIKVSSILNSDINGFSDYFTITPQAQACDDIYEPNNEISNPNVTAFSSILGSSSFEKSISGTIHEPGDWDHYRVEIQNTGTLSLTLTNVPDGFDLQLFDYDHDYVSGSFTAGNEEIITEITTTGYYYVIVGSLSKDSSCTPYTLQLSWIPEPPYLIVEPSSSLVNSSSGELTFNVLSNVNWSVTGKSTWLSASKTNPTTLSVSYAENTLTDARSASIILSGDGVPSLTVIVDQAGAPCTLDVTPVSQAVDSLSGTTSFTVTSNVTWSVIEDAEWLSVTRNDNIVELSYDANPTISPRSALITITGGECSETATVTQSGDQIIFSVSIDKLSLDPYKGSTTTFDINANIDWNIEHIPAWIEIIPSSGSGSSLVTVNALESNNTGANQIDSIFVIGGEKRYPMIIEQDFVTGIIEGIESKIQVYPNPADKVIFIELGIPLTNFMISITDMHGSHIYIKSYKKNQNFSIDISELIYGTYQLEIISNQGRIVKTFIKL